MIVISEEAASRSRRSTVQDLTVHLPAEIVGELVRIMIMIMMMMMMMMMMIIMMMMMIIGGGASGRDHKEHAGEPPSGDL